MKCVRSKFFEFSIFRCGKTVGEINKKNLTINNQLSQKRSGGGHVYALKGKQCIVKRGLVEEE